MSRAMLLAVALCLGTLGARADEQPLQLQSTLDGAHEVPPVQTNGTGRMNGTFDRSSKRLTYTITYQNLSGPVVAAHFHGPASPGQNANVAVPIQPPLTSPIKGTATLNDEQAKQLVGEEWYVNLHTAAHPGGEIRGQVLHGGP